MQELLFTNYFFSKHSAETVRGWARALRRLRFCGALGGHANDGDNFRCALCFCGEAGLLRVCQSLGIRLNSLPWDNPLPLPGKAYSGEEFGRFRRPVVSFPRYEQPGHRVVFGVPAYAWIGRDVVELDLSGADGDRYVVTEADFQNAKHLDDDLGRLGLELRDPPLNSRHCVCPKFWPEFFTNEAARPCSIQPAPRSETPDGVN